MRGVSEIISYILIALLVISLISFILSWGLPYLEKRQDEIKTKAIFNHLFNEDSSSSIPTILKRVITLRTSERVGGYEGFWEISNKSITFSFLSKFSPVDSQNWVTVYGCLKNVCEFLLEPFYEVQVLSERSEDKYLVRYRILLKNVKIEDNVFEIKFDKAVYSSSRFITISFVRRDDISNIIYLSAG